MQSNSEVQEEIFDLTVLIIDDDMFSSDIMKRYLINKYHILQASTYEEVFILSYSYPQALALYKEAYSRISIIILDNQIGSVHGASLAKKIRTFEGNFHSFAIWRRKHRKENSNNKSKWEFDKETKEGF